MTTNTTNTSAATGAAGTDSTELLPCPWCGKAPEMMKCCARAMSLGINCAEHGFKSAYVPSPATGGEPARMTVDDLMRVVRANWGDDAAIERAFHANITARLAARELDVEAELLAAADAVVARWDSPKWKDEAPTADFIARLRRACEATRRAATGTPAKSAPASAVPDDQWKMVPINPTPKMIDATFNDRVEGESHNARNRRIYAAMIATAPEQASAAVNPQTIGEVFASVGGWMAGGELGYPSFGSMEALQKYTVKSIRAYLATQRVKVASIDTPEFKRLLDEAYLAATDAHNLGNDYGTAEKLGRAESALIEYIDATMKESK